MRRALVTALVGACVALAGLATALPPAASKEGVVARVLTPIPRDARPGARLKVVWTLSYVDGGKRRPFGAGRVFIRLFGPGGSRSRRVYATELERGRYRARVTVPRGGVRRVAIGLMGMRCAGSCRPDPVLFRIADDPLR